MKTGKQKKTTYTLDFNSTLSHVAMLYLHI